MVKNDKDIQMNDILSNISLKKTLYKRIFILGIILVTIIRFTSTPTYKSEAIILPKTSQGLDALNYNNPLLAAGLGSLGTQKSPILNTRSYPLIILGTSFLDKLLNEVFTSEKYGERKLGEILSEYNRIELDNSQKSKNKLSKLLSKKLIKVNTDQLSSSVEIDIIMNEKKLSTDVLERTIYLLNEFQNDLLQQKARNKSEYLLKTSLNKKEDLFSAEDNLRIFLDENKGELSPSQALQLKILNREITTSEQIYLSAITQLEKSKIEEVENLDRIFVISAPTAPHKKSNMSFSQMLTFYIMLFTIGVIINSIISIRFYNKN